jgi:hypothetical protein
MSTRVAESVMSVLATLGFQADLVNTDLELVIDQFDSWKNPEHGMVYATPCSTCSAEILQ